MKKFILTIFALAAIASAALQAQDLVILHLNDTHSHIDPERSGKNAGHAGVIETAAYIDQVRADEGKCNVLLLHAGDFSQGTSYFTELNGDMEIDVLNATGYDVVCLGNHEFDNGMEALARRLANLIKDKTEQMVNDESIEDTLLDLASYAIMTLEHIRGLK